jgi:predicted site-specific integrase-resolvase
MEIIKKQKNPKMEKWRKKEFLSKGDIERILGVSQGTLWSLEREGRIVLSWYRTGGGHYRYRRCDIEKILSDIERTGRLGS